MKKSKDILREIENIIFDIHRSWVNDSYKSNRFVEDDLKERIEKELSKFIFKKTEREPIILVAII